MASVHAAATGSIFLLLVGMAAETHRHVVKHRNLGRIGKAQRLVKSGAIATTGPVRNPARGNTWARTHAPRSACRCYRNHVHACAAC
jgi:hypothetical protein